MQLYNFNLFNLLSKFQKFFIADAVVNTWNLFLIEEIAVLSAY